MIQDFFVSFGKLAKTKSDLILLLRTMVGIETKSGFRLTKGDHLGNGMETTNI